MKNYYIDTRSEAGQEIPNLSVPLILFPDEADEEHKRWDLFLDKKRNNIAEIHAKYLSSNLDSNKPLHDKTMRWLPLKMQRFLRRRKSSRVFKSNGKLDWFGFDIFSVEAD